MNLKLTQPYPELENSFNDYIKDWKDHEEDILPTASDPKDDSFHMMLENWKEETTDKIREKGLVPATLYFLINEKEKILGAIHFRHELNDWLLKIGGHIGYGVRPSERKKGYASIMLKLVLEKCRDIGLKKVLITCLKDNVGSYRTIEKNGGILEDIVHVNNKDMRRYWIEL